MQPCRMKVMFSLGQVWGHALTSCAYFYKNVLILRGVRKIMADPKVFLTLNVIASLMRETRLGYCVHI